MTPPRLSPSKELLEAPIWTTWARYFSRVSQAKVLKYAHEIVSRNLQVRCRPPAWEAGHAFPLYVTGFDRVVIVTAPGLTLTYLKKEHLVGPSTVSGRA